MVCGTLVLAMISTAAVFLSRMNNGAVKESRTLYQLQTVEMFVKEKIDYKNISDITTATLFGVSDGTVFFNADGINAESPGENDTVVVTDSEITSIAFAEETDGTATIVKCTISYDEDQSFTFVAYAENSVGAQIKRTEPHACV